MTKSSRMGEKINNSRCVEDNGNYESENFGSSEPNESDSEKDTQI